MFGRVWQSGEVNVTGTVYSRGRRRGRWRGKRHPRRTSEAVVGQRRDAIGVSSPRPMSSMSFHQEYEEHRKGTCFVVL